jgi:hypothetical protein
MKFVISVIAAASFVSAPAITPAQAQIGGPKTRVVKCGSYKQICEAARMSHVGANRNVSGLLYCHFGGCGLNLKRGEYYFIYWR